MPTFLVFLRFSFFFVCFLFSFLPFLLSFPVCSHDTGLCSPSYFLPSFLLVATVRECTVAAIFFQSNSSFSPHLLPAAAGQYGRTSLLFFYFPSPPSPPTPSFLTASHCKVYCSRPAAIFFIKTFLLLLHIVPPLHLPAPLLFPMFPFFHLNDVFRYKKPRGVK